MREKIRAAIVGADCHSLGFLDRAVDAVLDAMREPDLPAQEAGAMAIIKGRRECFSPSRALEVWQAMIDAARTPTKEAPFPPPGFVKPEDGGVAE